MTEVYHTYGSKSHSEVAKELEVSTSLAHLIEEDIFLKFALSLFQPDWAIKHPAFRRLKDKDGNPVRFGQGEYSGILEEVVRNVVKSSDARMYRTEYEKRVVDISKHIEFRNFVVETLRGEE